MDSGHDDDDEYVVDSDGHSYPTVKIGNQIWMKENYKETRMREGSTIFGSNKIPTNHWRRFTYNEIPAMCYYENDELRGALYNCYAVKELKVPSGWRVPTDEDFDELVENVKEKFGG